MDRVANGVRLYRITPRFCGLAFGYHQASSAQCGIAMFLQRCLLLMLTRTSCIGVLFRLRVTYHALVSGTISIRTYVYVHAYVSAQFRLSKDVLNVHVVGVLL